MTSAYPLSWPAGFPRTPTARREKGQFRTAHANALGKGGPDGCYGYEWRITPAGRAMLEARPDA